MDLQLPLPVRGPAVTLRLWNDASISSLRLQMSQVLRVQNTVPAVTLYSHSKK